MGNDNRNIENALIDISEQLLAINTLMLADIVHKTGGSQNAKKLLTEAKTILKE